MSITAMKQALAKVRAAQQCHPNAVMTLLCEADELLDQAIATEESLATQEPVACHPDPDALHASYIMGVQDGKKVRDWVELTDEEIQELHYQVKVKGMGVYRTEDIYRAIEAKLRSKNT